MARAASRYCWNCSGVTKRSTGIFYKDITIDAAGQWVARWIATGAVIDALEYVIEVPPSKLASP